MVDRNKAGCFTNYETEAKSWLVTFIKPRKKKKKLQAGIRFSHTVSVSICCSIEKNNTIFFFFFFFFSESIQHNYEYGCILRKKEKKRFHGSNKSSTVIKKKKKKISKTPKKDNSRQ